MSFEDFLLLHSEKSSKLSVFTDTEFLEDNRDAPVTNLQIEEIEKEYNVVFPTNYKEFCKKFGGGYFGYTMVYSLDRTGEWFIFDKLDEIVSYGYSLSAKFLPFSDDQTGGIYCFVREGVVIKDELVFIDEVEDIEEMPSSNFIECLLQRAYM
ncbi:SMI1/KNR4 family protein [Fibrella forsythiae]|uniref:SMI1/KNR4 family protein n=1 Tax=Fibrella forsythiae TaxID=2817061 RepID=A0ABS3JSW1_9BACT|nr:SMI1/KNR4 family protein [Fibrella forsythiae]MBO0953100.1 SMI1/KNR4 family protein [Fibrella forsythiae]